MRFYSRSTGSTYLAGVHQGMPDDVLPISEERFLSVIARPAPGKVRGHDDDGLPVLLDPSFSEDELAAAERAWRDEAVASTEWLVNRHRDEQDMQLATTLTAEQFAELLVYRQALRDWPQSQAFPDAEQRPVAPAFLSALEGMQ